MKILIAGAGGFAKECSQIVKDCKWSVAGFVVRSEDADPPRLWDENRLSAGIPNSQISRKINLPAIMLGVGTSPLRKRLLEKFKSQKLPPIAHPSAIFGTKLRFQNTASIFCIGVIISEACTIGRACLIDKGVIISHDCNVDDYAVLSPGVRLGGGAEIGEGATLGMGAIVLPGIRVGKWATIGAGAVVTQDIPDNATAVGVPAKVIKTKSEGWHLA